MLDTGHPTAQASGSFIKGRVAPGLHLNLLLVSDGFQALMKAMGPSTPRENTPQYLDKTCYVQFQGLNPPIPKAHAWTIRGPVGDVLALVPPALSSTTVCSATSSPLGNPIVALWSQMPWINLVEFNVGKYLNIHLPSRITCVFTEQCFDEVEPTNPRKESPDLTFRLRVSLLYGKSELCPALKQ